MRNGVIQVEKGQRFEVIFKNHLKRSHIDNSVLDRFKKLVKFKFMIFTIQFKI